MTYITTNWILRTIGVGLLPAFVRLSLGALIPGFSPLFTCEDLLFFSLVMNIETINELGHIRAPGRRQWAVLMRWLSGSQILFCTIVITIFLVSQAGIGLKTNQLTMIITTVVLSVAALLIGYSVFCRTTPPRL
jgi:hypothetical protein